MSDSEENTPKVETPGEESSNNPLREPSSSPNNVGPDNWQQVLEEEHKTIPKSELKRKKKEIQKQKRLQRQQELEQKAQELVDQQFSMIFNKKVFPYTIIFFLIVTIMGIFTLFFRTTTYTNWLIITTSLTGMLGFLLLFFLSRIRAVHGLLFAEKKTGIKILISVFILILAFLLVWILWFTTDPISGPNWLRASLSTNSITPLMYSQFMGTVLSVVFFGWNIIQILFVRQGLDIVSIQSQARMEMVVEGMDERKMYFRFGLYNFLLGLIPYLFIPLTVWLILIFPDTTRFWNPFEKIVGAQFILDHTGKFTPPLFFYSDWIANTANAGKNFWYYFVEIWWGTAALQRILIWFGLIYILLIVMTIHQKQLLKASYQHKTPNIYSNWFFMLIWIVLWAKSFSILKGILSVSEALIKPLTGFDQFFDSFTDFILMILTLTMAMRGFGRQMMKWKLKSVTQYNVALMAFLFAISYFGGQMTLLTGESFGGQITMLSLVTNIIVLLVDIIFYFWYSSYVLQRKGFTRKLSYTLYEAKDLLLQLSQRIKNSMLQTIENEEIITSTLNNYLLESKIALETAEAGAQDGTIKTLAVAEVKLDAQQKLDRVLAAYNAAKADKDRYEHAIKELENAKKALQDLKNKQSTVQKEINKSPIDLQAKFSAKTEENEVIASELRKIKEDLTSNEQAIQNVDTKLSQARLPPPPTSQVQGEVASTVIPEPINTKALDEVKFKLQEQSKLLNQKFRTAEVKAEKISSELNTLKETMADFEVKKSELFKITEEIGSTEKMISALEINLVTLKERAEEAAPMLQSAELANQSAEVEFNAVKSSELARNQLKEAQTKLVAAQEKYDFSQKQLSEAEIRIASTKPIDECKQVIQEAKVKITEQSKTVNSIKDQLTDAQKFVDEKLNLRDDAQSAAKAAKVVMDEAIAKINAAEKDLTRANTTLTKAENLKAELEEAELKFGEIEKAKKKTEKMSILEQSFKDLQTREKEARSLAKDLRKQLQAGQIGAEEVDKAETAASELKSMLENAKISLDEVKKIYSEFDSAQKNLRQLKEKQIDLTTSKSEVEKAQKAIEHAKDTSKEPQQILDEKNSILKNAEDVLKQSKAELGDIQASLTQAESDLKGFETEKANDEQDLVNRRVAEDQLKNTKTDAEKANMLLEKAKDFVTTRENELQNAENAQKQKEEDAVLDWKIYSAHADLRAAKKTFKDALRSAEANVKARESQVAMALQAKDEIRKARTT